MNAAKIQSPAQIKYLADMAKKAAVSEKNGLGNAYLFLAVFALACLTFYRINTLHEEFSVINFYVKPFCGLVFTIAKAVWSVM